ncbi:hypothetical protein U1Q18_041433 [Sarracenia purpurea var. burkii]
MQRIPLKLQTFKAISEESTEIIGVRRRSKDLIQRRIRGFFGDFPGEKKIVSGEEEAAVSGRKIWAQGKVSDLVLLGIIQCGAAGRMD